MDFQKVIDENLEKKTSIHNKHIWFTDILKFYKVLFCTYCEGLFCLFKKLK